MISAILFDLDGVLINSMPFHARAWQWIMEQYGVAITLEDAYLVEGYTSHVIARKFLDRAGKVLLPDEIDQMIDVKRNYYRQIARDVRMNESTVKVLDQLQEQGFKMALVTSSVRRNLNHTISEQEQRYFDAIITGDEVKHGKPEPEPYLTACAMLKALPQECIIVENAPLGIQSALAAKIFCVALTTTLKADALQAADLVINGDVTALAEPEVWDTIFMLASQKAAKEGYALR